jgi:ankyrin repeat protein/Ran GTPase-activating protein (RanGAP) involved in mRNA processing and transport
LPFWFTDLQAPNSEIATLARRELGLSLHEAKRFSQESR